MPKKRKTTKTSDSGKSKKKKVNAAPVLRLLLILVIIGLIIWFWPHISNWVVNTWGSTTNWVVNTWEGLLGLFGIGLALIVVFLAIVIWIFVSGRFSLFTRYWKWWLGGIPLAKQLWVAKLARASSAIPMP
jgi:hypothetical protein